MWEQAGGWFVAEISVHNSALLQPDDGGTEPYALVNYVQAPCSLGAFLRRMLTRPSFHTYVRRLLSENGMVSFPLLARRATSALR